MTLLKQFIVTLVCTLVFLILLSLQLDQQLQTSWFIIFIPLFVLVGFKVLIILFRIIMHVRQGIDMSNVVKFRIFSDLSLWFLIAVFQILICFQLEELLEHANYLYTFIPLWLFLLIFCGKLVHFQYRVIQQS